MNKGDETRDFIAQEVLFASEAAKYLGISTQRLNQLVHANKLTPVKISRAGTLFLKIDLDERKKELSSFLSSKLDVRNMKIENNKMLQEAVNYFTVQSLFNYSDKKAEPVFNQLSQSININEPLTNNIAEVSYLIKIDASSIENAYDVTIKSFEKLFETDYVVKRGQDLYPNHLAKTKEAPLFLFMRGNIQLVNRDIVSVVGTRNPSPDGIKKASTLGNLLGKYKIVVASGLAKGIDTAAHSGALDNKYLTIAVIGTPLTKTYPKENAILQQKIAEEGLVISQFPPSASVHRWHFPMRNAIMSGISLATVIIEAGETSGALIQADYALKQGRLVFIPQSALENPKLVWPQKYIKREGAASFSKIDELISKLENSRVIDKSVVIEQINLFDKEAGSHYVYRD